MRLHVNLLGFSIWLLFLHCAQCQKCLRENIKYENTEPVAKASYPDGETVRVRCMTGYTGFYRLKCEKGKWKNVIERQCAKKKCSHPGDTPNGNFTLSEGTEFVYGVTVVYTCRTGYEITSRTSQRTCRAQGWDNNVPLCEEVKCPAIHTDGDITASGNTEEGSYGEVIHFECVSSDKMIAGSSEIQCRDTGKWSDSVPKCIDITCTAPDIPNGQVVEQKPEYQKDAILKYICNLGFKKREGTPKCAKFGWTIKPECDEVTCELKSTIFGVKKIIPEGKTIFEDGERVEITCSEKHWLFGTKETSKTFTCQYNGRWDSEPVCQEIRCQVPRDQHVSYPEYYFRADMKLGTKQYYNCEVGYEKMAAEATCTEDGWTPNPLCAKMCAAPNIPNAEIVGGSKSKYQINSRILYKCLPGFEPEQPVQITCDFQAHWTGIQECTELCPDPSVKNGFIYKHPSNKKKIFYSCNTGYKPFSGKWWDSVTCSKGSWSDEPHCIREEECGALPSVHHGKLKQTKHTFRDGNTTEFECDPGFISTPGFIKCINGTWEKTVCKGTCVLKSTTSEVKNIKPEGKTIFRAGESVEITCSVKSLFSTTETKKSCTCQNNGQWDYEPDCQEVTCQVESTISGVKEIIPEGKTLFKAGESVEIICSDKHLFFTKDTRKSFTCQSNGKWDSKPVCEITCKVPHDQHVSGTEYYFSGNMKLGAKRSYSCKFGYREMAEEATCTRDGWTPKPLCSEIMCDSPRIPNAEIVEGQTINYEIGSRIEYKCRPGFKPEEPVQITCDSQGQWTGIQQCSDGTCQEQELKNIEILFGYPSVNSPYKPGHILLFRCTDDNMRFYGQHSIKCQPDGRWNYPYPQCGGTIQCSKPIKNLQFVTLSDEKTEYSNSELLTYTCKKPYNEIPRGVLLCQNGNWNGTFDCKSKICPPPPYLENGDFDTVSTKDNVTTAVSYTCQPYYVLTKQQDVYKCVDGKWETPPKCLRPCEIDDIVEKYNLKLPIEKVFIKHGDKYRLNCKDRWNTGSEMKAHVDVSCSNGNLQIDKSCDTQNQ